MPESLKPLVPCENSSALSSSSSSSSSSASAGNGCRRTWSSSLLISSSLLTTSLRPAKRNGVCPRRCCCRRPSVGNVRDVSERSSREVGSNDGSSSSSSSSEERSRLMAPSSFDSVFTPTIDDGPRYVDTANQASAMDSIELLQKAVVKKRKDSTRWW